MKLKYLKQLPYTQQKNLLKLAEIVVKKSNYCTHEEHTDNVAIYKQGRFYVSLCELCKREVTEHVEAVGQVMEMIKVG